VSQKQKELSVIGMRMNRACRYVVSRAIAIVFSTWAALTVHAKLAMNPDTNTLWREDGVDVMIKQRSGQTLVMAVNLLDRPVRAVVESPVLRRCGTLYGFRENREVSLREGCMKLEFAPYQVQITSNPKLGAKLKWA
jgi:hypothetical protein